MTTQTRFTPGPYLIADDKRFVYALNEDGINRIWFQVSQGFVSKHKRADEMEIEATASLLAAAPRLYAALETMLEGWDCLCDLYGWDKDHTKASAEARAALKQARGEA